MVLVDTSSWIHLLRVNGDVEARKRVEALLLSGDACWCSMVRLELWNGARSDRDKKALREFEQVLFELPITEEVWECAYGLARKTRDAGKTVPANYILIAACAQFHKVSLEHTDSDFDRIL